MSSRRTRIRFGVAAAIAALLAPGGARAAPAVIRHDLSVTLDPARHALAATDALTIRPGGAVRLDLALAGAATVKAVTSGGKPVPFLFEDGTIVLKTPEEEPGGTVDLAVAYEAPFDDTVPENPVNTENPGYGVTGAITDRGTFLSEEASWYPDIPGSQAVFRVRVDAPAGLEAVTSGRRLLRTTSGGRTVSEWETSRPLTGLALSAGRYAVREGRAGTIPVYVYFSPENEDIAQDYLQAAAGFIAFYDNLLGPYPFEKFAVVENFFPTGYGFPSWTLIGKSIVRLPFILETSLGHEIAHSWWGNGVLVDYSRGNWSEGLTTYVADYLYKERASPEEGREYRLKVLREYASLVPPDKEFPLKAFGTRTDPASRSIGYGKGMMVFHMARRRVGDDAFWNGLRTVVREKMGKTASWDDFDRAFTGHGESEPGSFFRPWVDRPGAPSVTLADAAATREGDRWKVTGRLVQKEPYYDLRIPVRLLTDNGAIEAVIPLAGEEMRFSLFPGARPRRLAADPDADVFRRLPLSEIPPAVNGIRGSESLVAVAARGLPPATLEAARTVLAALGRSEVPVLREEDTPPARLAGHDVLYLGAPQGAGCLPPLPKGLSLDAKAFSLEGVTYADPGDALFVALPRLADAGRVCAVFLPLSPEAAAQAARKIPHYGKYSYLAFSSGTSRAKGTWEPAASSTSRAFDGPE
ncbi:MAG: M1 family metallopeptidase [Gemmatimonadota bacterium]